MTITKGHGAPSIKVPKLEQLEEPANLGKLKAEVLDRETLQRRLLLCLFGLGTNMGIKAVTDAGGHGESERELRHVRRTFVTKDNLRRAIVKVVNATFEARNAAWSGEGNARASDSKSSAPGN